MNLERLLLLFGIFLMTVVVNAQTNFRPGYVVKTIGDTLKGEIDSRGDLLMHEVCKFRMNNKEKAMEFSPEDIVAFRFIDGKYFISKDLDGKKVFLEYLIQGRVSIFYMRDILGNHYHVAKDDIGISELKYSKQIVDIDGTLYENKSKNHLAMLNYYMKDVPEMHSRIDGMGEPEHRSLIKLAEEYNQMACKNDSCIIYKKKTPFIKCNLEIVGGVLNFREVQSYTDVRDFVRSNWMNGGVLVHLWIPRSNENFYYRTGVLFASTKTKTGRISVLKFPFQIEYVYPKGIIIPKFAIGVNIYQSLSQTLSMMGGFNVKIDKKVTIGASYDIDFDREGKSLFIPGKLFTQNFMAGLYINL